MIKQIWVAQCDVCGKIENAKITLSQYNEEGYTLPDRWGYGRTKDIHLCPECCKRMGKEG